MQPMLIVSNCRFLALVMFAPSTRSIEKTNYPNVHVSLTRLSLPAIRSLVNFPSTAGIIIRHQTIQLQHPLYPTTCNQRTFGLAGHLTPPSRSGDLLRSNSNARRVLRIHTYLSSCVDTASKYTSAQCNRLPHPKLAAYLPRG